MISALEEVLRDLGARLAAPDADLSDAVMARLSNVPRLLRPTTTSRRVPEHNCPLPRKEASGD